MVMKSIFATLTVMAGVSAATTVEALTVTSVDGIWQNASPAVSGEGTDQIRWGTQWKDYDLSGYDFNATSTDFEAYEGASFVIGTFDHLNFPVTGTFLETVDLAVSFTIAGLGEAITSTFSFAHLESYNWAKTCANGAANYQGVNSEGCADRVSATLNLGKTESFMIDGVTYVLDILGFHYEGELMSEFWTVEKEVNSAELVAVFRTLPPSEIPLPASGLLLLAGVAGLFAKRRFS